MDAQRALPVESEMLTAITVQALSRRWDDTAIVTNLRHENRTTITNYRNK